MTGSATRRINILQVTASLSVGGAERLLPGLVQRLDHERFAVRVFSISPLQQLRPELERLGVPVEVVGAPRFYEPRVFRELAQYVRRHRIDVIHTHLTDADVVGRIVGRALGVPVVSTMHSIPADYDKQKIHRRTLQKLTARTMAARIVGVSPRVTERYIAEWRLPRRRMVTIRNAVPMEPYLTQAPGTYRAASEGPVITNVARLIPAKAQHLLLDAASVVLRQRPDARFMIVGQGALEQPLKEQAAALGIAGQVTFTGLRRDIPEILGQSDIFVLSSLWEGLPVTAVEAMAAARPVVLTDVGGNGDLLDSGVEGLLVPPDNVPALAEALLALIDDHERREAMGRAARARVQRDFSMEQYIAQHEALYRDVLPRARERRAGLVHAGK